MNKIRKKQQKLAVINDLAGVGRCALAVALPVVSAMGVQCCPVPTSILSNNTAYPAYFFDDYTEKLPAYIAKWKELQFEFDGILTGFLGSAAQIDIVEDFIRYFAHSEKSTGSKTNGSVNENTLSTDRSICRAQVIIDPIMGDHGKTYATYTPDLCERMKQLVTHADILTPNLTEACILTDTPYQAHFSAKELHILVEKLAKLCTGKLVITGIDAGTYLANAVFDPQTGELLTLRKKRVAAERCGTGDVFSAIVAAGVLKGMPLSCAVKKASDFICLCLKETAGYEIGASDGVVFEPLLKYLVNT